MGADRRRVVEDWRHLWRRLERGLLAAGEVIVGVPPRLMAEVGTPARTCGKSDPVGALAAGRAALREPGRPAARLDGPQRELRLLAGHREDLAGERTRMICRLRIAGGDTKTEALRALKRRLSDIVYRALLADGTPVPLIQAA